MPQPKWIKPRLCTKPSIPLFHEIKFTLSHAARIENAAIQLLTRACLDWTAKYPATTAALAKLKVESPISTANFAVFDRMT